MRDKKRMCSAVAVIQGEIGMMKDCIYQELRNRVNEIRDIEKSEKSEEAYLISENGRMLIDTIRLMEELSNTARKNGLLELEKMAYSEEIIERGSKYLRQLICLVVDGADPDLTEEMGNFIYFTAGFSDYKALQCLLM